MTERTAPFSLTRAIRTDATRDGEPGWHRVSYCRKTKEARWWFRDFRLANLKGKRPRGHPEIKRNSHGKVLLAASQVWVEKDTDDLWVIKELCECANGRQEVYLRPYGSWMTARVVLDTTLRSNMSVWEDAVRRNQRRARTLVTTFTTEEITGFGIDPETGNRVSD